MAKMRIEAENGKFKTMAEGVTVLKIKACDDCYDDDKEVGYTFVNSDGDSFRQRFFFTYDGEVNENAVKRWGTLAHRALNTNDEMDVEFSDLVGCYVKGYVKHKESNGKKYAELDIWNKDYRLENATESDFGFMRLSDGEGFDDEDDEL